MVATQMVPLFDCDWATFEPPTNITHENVRSHPIPRINPMDKYFLLLFISPPYASV
jgi:hypothetical protein